MPTAFLVMTTVHGRFSFRPTNLTSLPVADNKPLLALLELYSRGKAWSARSPSLLVRGAWGVFVVGCACVLLYSRFPR